MVALDGDQVSGDAIAHNAELVDLLVLLSWPATSAAMHVAVSGRHVRDLPVLLFDMPPELKPDLSTLAIAVSNIERFFRVADVLFLGSGDRIAAPRSRGSSANSARSADGALTEIAVEIAPKDTASWGKAGRRHQIRLLLRGGSSPRSAEAWLNILTETSRTTGVGHLLGRQPGPGSFRAFRERLTLAARRRRLRRSDSVAVGRGLCGGIEPSREEPFALGWAMGSDDVAPVASPAGIWGSELHRANLFLDLPPFRFLVDRYEPRSILDVGCGIGGYVNQFQRWGVADAVGVDGFEASSDLLCDIGAYRQHDLRQPLDLGRMFDLVISTEVAEHLNQEFEQTYVDTVTRHAARLILFSAARPGQRGIGHVNLKPGSHWLDLFQSRGWTPNHFDTCAVRSLSTFNWFRRNLVLMVRNAAVTELSSRFARSPAGEVEIHARWIGQPAKVCEQLFTLPLPSIEASSAVPVAGAGAPSR